MLLHLDSDQIPFILIGVAALYLYTKLILPMKFSKRANRFFRKKEYNDQSLILINQKIKNTDYRKGDKICIEVFDNYLKAQIVKCHLQAFGIYCEIHDDNIGLNNYQYLIAIGGIRLYIHETDNQNFIDLTQSKITDESKYRAELMDLVKCSKCDHSDYLISNSSYKFAIVFLILVGIPVPFWTSHRYCKSCGNKWPV